MSVQRPAAPSTAPHEEEDVKEDREHTRRRRAEKVRRKLARDASRARQPRRR